MKNRTASSPILCAVVFSLIGASAPADLSLQGAGSTAPAELETIPAPLAPTAPAPAVDSVKPVPVATAKAAAPAPKHTTQYTVVAGDTWTSLAKKFNSTRKKLKALNSLAAATLKPGQVLLVPSTKSTKSESALATTAKAKTHHTYLAAQPVQDFDIPASTFASCPVPLPSPDDDTPATNSGDSSTMTDDGKPAPVAQLVSPAEMSADEKRQRMAAAKAEAQQPSMPVEPAPDGLVHHNSQTSTASTTSTTGTFPSAFNPPAPKPASHFNFNPFANQNSTAAASTDWGNRFLQQARSLGDQGIEYDEDWRPPGESHSWTMDCSNTTRYLYKVTAGIQLPRTASDQYYYLHLQGKAWDVPQIADGLPDTNYLRQNLKPGDLLFWENTYRPDRQPPITHVMVYLGTNAQGQWLMAGSQSSHGGEHNRRHGGPDVYIFRPSQPCGGYTTWLGMVHHTGRFCAFGRPLEADRSKLAVAEND